MRTSLFAVFAAALLSVDAGCASAPKPAVTGAATAPAAARRKAPKRDSKVILLDEIRASGAATAYDLVQSLRPIWLNKRGPTSIENEGDVHVYVGTTRMGDRDALREVAAASISSIRYLDTKEANYRFGPGHPYGAIVISTEFPMAPPDGGTTPPDGETNS